MKSSVESCTDQRPFPQSFKEKWRTSILIKPSVAFYWDKSESLGQALRGHTMGCEVLPQGAAVFKTALLTVDKINMEPKPKCPHEICIFPKGYGACLSKRLCAASAKTWDSASGLIFYNTRRGYDDKAKCSLQTGCVLQQFHLILLAASSPHGLVLSVHFLQIIWSNRPQDVLWHWQEKVWWGTKTWVLTATGCN